MRCSHCRPHFFAVLPCDVNQDDVVTLIKFTEGLVQAAKLFDHEDTGLMACLFPVHRPPRRGTLAITVHDSHPPPPFCELDSKIRDDSGFPHATLFTSNDNDHASKLASARYQIASDTLSI